MVVIVDYGMGNVRSLRNAFDFLGYDSIISRNISDLALADRIVLPGVGAFGDAITAIKDLGLEAPLRQQVLEFRKPLLGICLGMQLLANSSTEYGSHKGLGWIDADVVPLRESIEHKVPHVGWNEIEISGNNWLFKGLPKSPDFYFVHSFHMVCANNHNVTASSSHNGKITAAVECRNIVATQFHPEKSQDNGLKILDNWLKKESFNG